MKDVKQKMKDLNVQLDNLCQVADKASAASFKADRIKRYCGPVLLQTFWFMQFLPQDKVVEFARLSPVELLRETQKAIGDSRLADLHKELIEENKACNMSTRVRQADAQHRNVECMPQLYSCESRLRQHLP